MRPAERIGDRRGLTGELRYGHYLSAADTYDAGPSGRIRYTGQIASRVGEGCGVAISIYDTGKLPR